MPAPPQVQELVTSFKEQFAEYKNRNYDEYTTRDHFINPLFVALGWDVHNGGKLPEHEREVYFEDRIRREDVREDAISTIVGKKPDYSFRINKRRMFYVEAKKPAEDLARNKAHAYQVRAYGWNANLPVSVLTDFEEFLVYDCRIPPAVGDDPRTGLVQGMAFTYEQYLDEWDKIAGLLSRDSVLSGSLDTFREAVKPTRGAQTVDAAFLRDISLWREALARDINRRNPHLSQDDLNYAVQMTINRIIFLRICEDRGIERPETLKGTLARSRVGEVGQEAQVLRDTVYPALVRMFRRADDVYNSGLFHFNKNDRLAEHYDDFTPNLEVGDEVLADIINHLYYPYPYKFDVIPVEILGQVYEQFLGKVIVKQPGGDVDVDYKPEVRKAGGVYYTPTYIVDYIVEHTVGKLVEGKTPEQVSELRVLDPACGSGSFLVGAYQHLLDWHLRYYTRDPEDAARLANKRKDRPIEKLPSNAGEMQQGGPGYRLTITERKRILRNNIYGVDIDPQAVEVTKLSLLLKVVEGEQERQEQLRLDLEERERILPDLGNNIKWGNSLIGPDFYTGTQLGMFDETAMRRVNAFDWQREFPNIMGRGGFDAVIGNPPYVRPHHLETDAKEYFWGHYSTFVGKSDLYCCFIEKGISLLCQGGSFGFIISDGWLRLDSFEALRLLLLRETAIDRIIDFTGNVFASANVKTAILLLTKEQDEGRLVEVVTIPTTSDIRSLQFKLIPQAAFRRTYKSIFDLSLDDSQEKIKDLMRRLGKPLDSQFAISFGLKTGDDEMFLSYSEASPEHRRLLRGEDVHRYSSSFKGEYVWYVPAVMRAHRQTARPGTSDRFEQPKVLIRDTGGGLQGTFDGDNFYVKDVLVIAHPHRKADDLKVLTGILNSRLMRFYYETSFPTLHVQRDELASLPIRTIDFSNPTDKAHHDRMVQLVDRMLALHKALASTNNPTTKATYQRDIEATDRAIDDLVYTLYGLTEEERKIVEGAA